MNKNIVLLNSNEHRNLMLAKLENYAHLSSNHMAPLLVGEYMLAANNFPVVFVKDEANNELRSAGLFGLEEGENLLLGEADTKTTYVPMDFRRYPFYLAGNSETGEMSLCIDLESPRLSTEDGTRLFAEDGTHEQVIEEAKAMLQHYLQGEVVTREFVRFLSEAGLLIEANLTVTVAGEKKAIRGIYKIDEAALRDLKDEQVLELHKRNYFSAIYAHLSSLGQFQKLVQLKHERVTA